MRNLIWGVVDLSRNIDMKNKDILNASRIHRLSLGIKITIILTVLITLVSAISSLTIYDLSYKALKEEIRENLILLASHAAVTLDAEELAKITKPEDEGNETYLKLQKQLQKVKDSCKGKLRYVYTLNKHNDEYVYIIDATPAEDEENHSQIGEKFVAEDYTYIESAFYEATAEIKPTDDEVYGGSIQTGYAPIKDDNGNVKGVLAIDMDVMVLAEKEKMMKEAGVTALGLAFTLSILFSFFFAKYLTRPIMELTRGTKSVAEGNFDTIVEVNRNDELGELAKSFNSMTHDLEKSHEELKNYSVQLIQPKFPKILSHTK